MRLHVLLWFAVWIGDNDKIGLIRDRQRQTRENNFIMMKGEKVLAHDESQLGAAMMNLVQIFGVNARVGRLD